MTAMLIPSPQAPSKLKWRHTGFLRKKDGEQEVSQLVECVGPQYCIISPPRDFHPSWPPSGSGKQRHSDPKGSSITQVLPVTLTVNCITSLAPSLSYFRSPSLSTCTPMFTAALFTIAKTWKQPKCPSTDEWIKKMWYIYAMEYYSAI